MFIKFEKFIPDLKHLEKLDVDIKPLIKEMMQTPDKFKAGATSLEVVKNIDNYVPGGKITGFEELITQGEKFRSDIVVTVLKRGKPILILIDTKNYKNASGLFGDFKQIKAYLSEIDSFDELLIIQQKVPP